MAKLFDKETIFNKLKNESIKKGFNINPDRVKMSAGCPTMVELLEVIATVIHDILVVDNSMSAEITATNLKLNMGGQLKGVARKDDEVTIDFTTDSTFMTFIETLLSTLQTHIATPQPPNSPVPLIGALYAALNAVKPTKVVGKITTASDKVVTS